MAENGNGPWWGKLADKVLSQGIGWALLTVVVLWILHSVNDKLDGLESSLTTHNATSQQIVDQLKANGDEDAKDRQIMIRLQEFACEWQVEGKAIDKCKLLAMGGGQ